MSDYGQCLLAYSPYTLCTLSPERCAYGYSCQLLSGTTSYYCVANVSTNVPGFTGWAKVGGITMAADHGTFHTGQTSAKISGADTASYAYNMVLFGALQGETQYLLDFWALKGTGSNLTSYAVYDSMNNAWLSDSGTWIFAPSSAAPAGGIITPTTGSPSWQEVVKVFRTLRNAKIQLRFYAPGSSSSYYIDDVSVNEANDFSMLAWVRADSPQAGGALFSQVGTTAGNKPQGINWSIDASNMLNISMYSSSTQGIKDSASAASSASAPLSLADGKWHQAALSVVRSGNYSVYLDGALKQTAQFTLGSMGSNATLFIGGSGTGSGFTGELGEVRFYKRALTPQDIADHYAGWFQQVCKIDLSMVYANTAAKNLTATYNADLKIRKLLPETVLSMPFDAQVTSDAQGMIVDYSRFLGAGTKTGAIWTPNGAVGGAYVFNGNADRIVLPSALIGSTSDFTITAWVNASTISATPQCVLCSYSPSNPSGMIFAIGSDGFPFIKVGASGIPSPASNRTTANTWHHLAVVRSNNGATITWYVNGTRSISSAFATPFTTASTLAIGNTPDGASGYGFHGTIDEVRVINRALTDAEVMSVYKDNSLVSSQILPLSQQ